VQPSRNQWWWREAHLKQALKGNRSLDHFFYWKLRGRKSPDATKWTPAQRRTIETALWLYELDARISRKYLFGKPVHALNAKQLASVIDFTPPTKVPAQAAKPDSRRRPFSWVWIEYFDKRNALKKTAKLTRAEMNGIIAAMKFCLEHFTHG
jgi:hypothetical protein